MKSIFWMLICGIFVWSAKLSQGDEKVWFQQTAVNRLVRYAKIDTQSKEEVNRVPSTDTQFNLARVLLEELRGLGLTDVRLDEEHCYLYATVASTLPPEQAARIPVIGFIAHLDTSSSVEGSNVHPLIHSGYGGEDITLPGDATQVIRVQDNPHLLDQIGAEIITSDGTTLLGADDKAGIAEIMTAVEYWMKHPEEKRGTIKIGFTPDEEVGNGAIFFDIQGFGADFAYTVDGGTTGEISDETFSAKTAMITFTGKNTHPGYAKDIMINSLYATSYFVSLFPEDIRPETTTAREGYLHPYDFIGKEDESRIKVLIRDFEQTGMESKVQFLQEMIATTQARFPRVQIRFEVSDSYSNMNPVLNKYPEVVKFAEEAMKRAGIQPIRRPIRGGTDGSRLTFMGLPTPNLFAGMQNPHSRIEWVSSRAMGKSIETILNLATVWAEKGMKE